MFWFSRPPYVRWLAAGAIVAAAFAVELWPQATVAHPFASEDVNAGEPVQTVEWREVATGILPPVSDVSGRAAYDIAAGEPLLPSSFAGPGGLPADWWAVSMPLPPAARAGAAVMLVLDGRTVEGIVVTPASDDPLAFEPEGLVGVPAASASSVAASVRSGDLVVLVQP